MLKDIVTYLRFKHRRLIDSRSDSGFTIMELVIVLGIIGVLLTIVFLAIPRLTAAASNRSRDADVQTIYQAIKDYATAHNTALPTGAGAGSPFKAAMSTNNPCTHANFTSGVCFAYGDQFELGHYKETNFEIDGTVIAAANGSRYGTTQAASRTLIGGSGTNLGVASVPLPDVDNMHILVGVKCPATNTSAGISADGTNYIAGTATVGFRQGSKRQFVIVYRHDTENNPYRCIQG